MRATSAGRFVRLHLPFLLWAGLAAVALLSPLDVARDPPWPQWLAPLRPWADKIVHGGLFFVMAVLGYRSLGSLPQLRRPLIVTAVSVLAYSALLELLQTFSVVRQSELADLMANAVGVLIFGVATWVAGRR